MKKIVIAIPALSAILYNYNSGRDQCLKRVWNQKTDGEKMVPLRQGFVTA